MRVRGNDVSMMEQSIAARDEEGRFRLLVDAVLLAHHPAAGKAEALAQPQHGFEALNGAPGRVEGLEAAEPRHGPLDPKVVTLDALLRVFGDVMHRGARQARE